MLLAEDGGAESAIAFGVAARAETDEPGLGIGHVCGTGMDGAAAEGSGGLGNRAGLVRAEGLAAGTWATGAAAGLGGRIPGPARLDAGLLVSGCQYLPYASACPELAFTAACVPGTREWATVPSASRIDSYGWWCC